MLWKGREGFPEEVSSSQEPKVEWEFQAEGRACEGGPEPGRRVAVKVKASGVKEQGQRTGAKILYTQGGI